MILLLRPQVFLCLNQQLYKAHMLLGIIGILNEFSKYRVSEIYKRNHRSCEHSYSGREIVRLLSIWDESIAHLLQLSSGQISEGTWGELGSLTRSLSGVPAVCHLIGTELTATPSCPQPSPSRCCCCAGAQGWPLWSHTACLCDPHHTTPGYPTSTPAGGAA